jgi:hypothetical protein
MGDRPRHRRPPSWCREAPDHQGQTRRIDVPVAKLNLIALCLAMSCAVAGTSAARPARAYQHNQSDLEFLRSAAKPATTTKPGAGHLGAPGPRGKVGSTLRGRAGRSK